MVLYILDTDHLSLYGRNHPQIIERLRKNHVQLTTTAINVEEQLRGRLAQVAEARDGSALSNAYQQLMNTVILLSEFRVLQHDANSHTVYQSLKTQRLRVGTQDLRIATIALAHNGILLNRNLQDFDKVPGLAVQDWSVKL